jgi:hypothetical protein
MPKDISGKPITIKLDASFASALREYRQFSPLHLSISEQVRRALICYWTNSNNEAGARAVNIVFADDGEDAEATIVEEESKG